MRSKRLIAVLTCVLAVTLAAGCGGDKGSSQTVPELLDPYVGKVNGIDAYIAVVTDHDRASGLVTDANHLATWLAASDLSDDGGAKLVSRDGAEVGEVKIEGKSATGEVKLGTQTFSFDATLASGKAGFFEAAARKGDDSFQAGWVVLPDGSEHGSLDTFVQGTVTTQPAPRLEPTITVPGIGSAPPRELTSEYFDTVPASSG